MVAGLRALYWVLDGILSILTVLELKCLGDMSFSISRKRFHETDNWFLISLALADLCVGLVHFPEMACISASLCSKYIATAVRWLFFNSSMTNVCALPLSPTPYPSHPPSRAARCMKTTGDE